MIRDAIVQYGSLFKHSRLDDGQSFKLPEESYVPEQFQELHKRLIFYRDKLFAHFDPKARKAKQDTDDPHVWVVDSPRPQDFKDQMANMKALVVHILKTLQLEMASESQKLIQNGDAE